MEKVLHDVHLAQAMARQAPADSIDYYIRYYEEAVFEKYGIDSKTFYESLAWYERHTDNLAKVYDKLAEQFGEGGGFSGNSYSGSMAGDTLNIWHGQPFILLNSQVCNHFTYEEKADTALRSGDLLQWKFNVEWHYHEGAREATALLVVRYDGDSTTVSQYPVYSSGMQTVSTRIGNRHVQRIECVIYQDAHWSKRPQILTLATPELLRIRQKEEPQAIDDQADTETARKDSAQKKEANGRLHLRDSLLRADSLREQRPHFR